MPRRVLLEAPTQSRFDPVKPVSQPGVWAHHGQRPVPNKSHAAKRPAQVQARTPSGRVSLRAVLTIAPIPSLMAWAGSSRASIRTESSSGMNPTTLSWADPVVLLLCLGRVRVRRDGPACVRGDGPEVP